MVTKPFVSLAINIYSVQVISGLKPTDALSIGHCGAPGKMRLSLHEREINIVFDNNFKPLF